MTEDEAWVIEEMATPENGDYKGPKVWHRYPSIVTSKDVDDMEPTTLEACITYLRDDPFKEGTSNHYLWVTCFYNLVTHERIYCDVVC